MILIIICDALVILPPKNCLIKVQDDGHTHKFLNIKKLKLAPIVILFENNKLITVTQLAFSTEA